MEKKLGVLEKYRDTGVLLIRLAFGFRLIYGTLDNVVSYNQMLHFRDFLEGHRFPFPLISAFVSVAAQFLAGLSFISGLWIRFFSALMVLNFLIALLMVHMRDTYLHAAPAIHLLVVSLFLLFNGGGRWSLKVPKKKYR